jgi:probable HAF family extracellular repeat protein
MTRFLSLRRFGLLAALLLVDIGPALHAQIEYSVTDIGTLGGTEGFGYAVDARGQVAGASLASGNNGYRAFRTAPNRPINPATDALGTLGGVQSYAQAINVWGQVAGSAAITDSAPLHAFRTARNRPINPATDDLGTLDGTQSEAWGINDWGQVVGYASTNDDTILHAFRTAPNRPINPATDDLGTLGGLESEAFGINVRGQVVGYSATNDDPIVFNHAFCTAPNRPINPATDDLGTLGGMDSFAWAINDLGQVAGSSYTDSDDTIEHAFLFSGGVIYDLNNLIPAHSGWELQVAYGINDAGQIVGIGTHNGQLRPFLLTPARN